MYTRKRCKNDAGVEMDKQRGKQGGKAKGAQRVYRLPKIDYSQGRISFAPTSNHLPEHASVNWQTDDGRSLLDGKNDSPAPAIQWGELTSIDSCSADASPVGLAGAG